MSAIAGVISKSEIRRRDVGRMVDAMTTAAAPTARYECEDRKLDLCFGWSAPLDATLHDGMLWNEMRDIGLIFLGEDFTDPAIVSQLTGKHSEAGAKSVLALYEKLGPDFIEHLNGWFRGLIVDKRGPFALLFNDRYGLGRIYWRENSDGIHLASEAKALLAVLPDARRLDARAVAETISCGSVMQDRSLFSGVSLMPPGSMWRFGPQGECSKERYFSPAEWEQQGPLEPEAFYQQLKATLLRIFPRYVAAPSIAMSLTGGLDGRMIMAGTRPTAGTLPCYTFNGPYRECADLRYARRLANLYQQEHRTISVGEAFLSEFGPLAERAVYVSDGAMDVTGAVELYVNRIARDIAPVRLTGNYGSEIVRGNVAFRAGRVDRALLTPEIAALVNEAEGTYRTERNCPQQSFIAFKQTPWHHYARLSVEQSELTVRTPFLDNELVSLMYRAPPASYQSVDNILRFIGECDPRLRSMASDRGLRENGGAINRLACEAIEFSVKAEYAYDYGMPHWLARLDRLIAPLHPEKIFLGRHKFYHFRIWYKEKLGHYLSETLLRKSALERGYFRPEIIERMVREHLEGSANWTRELHRALTLELIHKQLLER